MTYNDETVIEFGKYRGEKIANVPAQYLIYLYENVKSLDIGLKTYIKENEKDLRKEMNS